MHACCCRRRIYGTYCLHRILSLQYSICSIFAELLFISTRKLSLIAHRHKYIRVLVDPYSNIEKLWAFFLLLYFPHIIIMIFALIVFHAASFATNVAFSLFVIIICSEHHSYTFSQAKSRQLHWIDDFLLATWYHIQYTILWTSNRYWSEPN